MSILVTGGTGFIGSEVVRVLLDKGHDVAVLYRGSGSERRLADVAGKVQWIRGDISDFSHVLNAVKASQPTTIYHMGAIVSIPSDADPATAIQTNAMGTFYVLEAARLFDVLQVIFASTIGTYGYDMQGDTLDDTTLQRPNLVYGVTKVFGEHLGLFYKRKYGLDFRGLRYQSIVGKGVTASGVVQFTSWAIEESIKGNPYTITVSPKTRVPIMYIKDAVRATIELASAPLEHIKMVNYLINGVTPTPSAGELVAVIQAKIPSANISFDVDEALQQLLDLALRPIDGSRAEEEWGWKPKYDLEHMVDDFIDAF